MKTTEEIDKQILGIDWFIKSHKNQIDYHIKENFDIDKIEEYSRKIKLLQVERSLLEWVLSE